MHKRLYLCTALFVGLIAAAAAPALTLPHAAARAGDAAIAQASCCPGGDCCLDGSCCLAAKDAGHAACCPGPCCLAAQATKGSVTAKTSCCSGGHCRAAEPEPAVE